MTGDHYISGTPIAHTRFGGLLGRNKQEDEGPAVALSFGAGGEVVQLQDKRLRIWDWVPSGSTGTGDAPGKRLYAVAEKEGVEHSVFLKDNVRGDVVAPEWLEFDGNSFKDTDPTCYCVLETDDGIRVHSKGSETQQLACASVNGRRVYAKAEHWLVYLAECDTVKSGRIPVAPIKLDKQKTVVKKLMKSLSITAIDSAVKLVEVSQAMRKKYSNEPETVELQPSRPASSHDTYLVLHNMRTNKAVMAFHPPGGCSHVSLSPYDMVLTTTTLRGDEIFMWDFSASTVLLIDQFRRGKTPGIIDAVVWAKGNRAIGVLSRGSGSVHWFNHARSEHRDWVVSGCGARGIGLAPVFDHVKAADANKMRQGEYSERADEYRLLVDCGSGILRSINTSSGKWEYEFDLKAEVPIGTVAYRTQRISPVVSQKLIHSDSACPKGDPWEIRTSDPEFGFDTLSQAEIELSFKKPAGSSRKSHIEFHTYAYDSVDEYTTRLNKMASVNSTEPVSFGKPSGMPVFNASQANTDGVQSLRRAIETNL